MEDIKQVKAELFTVLDTVQEAVQVADDKGVIKYVNPAFTEITGLSLQERIGQNVFVVAADSALAESLRNRRKVIGYKTKITGTNVEVLSNASFIVLEGQIVGAVEVSRNFNNVTKMTTELERKSKILEGLTDCLGLVTSNYYNFDSLIGNDNSLRKVVETAKKAAISNSNVLILGESGTGKEVFAHAIHSISNRKNKPFIKVNFAQIPESLIDYELFGYEAGAFSGAINGKVGKFQLANGGTIFLDEIGEINLQLQEKILNIFQQMEFKKIGGNEFIPLDVRVLAATNRDIKALVKNGDFREDFYYRFSGTEITIPPLRERKQDIGLLVKSLIVKLNRQLGKKINGLTKSAEQVLLSYDWPGNIKELENIIERSMIITKEAFITHNQILKCLEPYNENDANFMADIIPFNEMEQILLKQALNKFGYSVEGKKKAAKALNISLATLYNKLKKYQLSLFDD